MYRKPALEGVMQFLGLKNLLAKVSNISDGSRRNLALRKFTHREYRSLKNYLGQKTYDSELSTIWFNKVPLDVIFQFDSYSKPLFVFFHGAVDQSKTIVPHFVGLSYKRMLPANLLHIADSSLFYDDSIRTAWYLGCQNIKLQFVIQEIVTRLATYLQTDKIIFFGSSGGGYPSLYLSQKLSGSLAIVNSPATSVLHHPHRLTRVSHYLKAAFGASSPEDEDHILTQLITSDLRSGFDTGKGSVLYLLNINDKGNIAHHTEPFFQQFAEKVRFDKEQVQHVGNVHLMTGDWGSGHRYPPARLLSKLFIQISDHRADWSAERFAMLLSNIN